MISWNCGAFLMVFVVCIVIEPSQHGVEGFLLGGLLKNFLSGIGRQQSYQLPLGQLTVQVAGNEFGKQIDDLQKHGISSLNMLIIGESHI